MKRYYVLAFLLGVITYPFIPKDYTNSQKPQIKKQTTIPIPLDYKRGICLTKQDDQTIKIPICI